MSGYSPVGDTAPREANRSRFDLASVGGSPDDLTSGDESAPQPGGVFAPLAWVGLGLVALMAFLGWLLAG